MIECRRADGETITLELSASPIVAADGAVSGAALIMRDVTGEIEAARVQQKMKNRLADSSRLESVGRLAGGIAHDFNNLLSVVLNCAAFAGELLDDDHPALDELEQIRQAADRAAALTRQLLMFGRRGSSRPTTFDPEALILDLQGLLARTLGEQIELRLDLDAPPVEIRCDPSQFEQVVMNLVVNARDAMAGGGLLRVSTSVTRVDPAQRRAGRVGPGEYYTVRVEDTGAGIDPGVREHIFEPFVTTKPAGGGLGLATSHGIVAGAGGCIECDSEVGRGTVFTVHLPLVTRSIEGDHAPASCARRN